MNYQVAILDDERREKMYIKEQLEEKYKEYYETNLYLEAIQRDIESLKKDLGE